MHTGYKKCSDQLLVQLINSCVFFLSFTSSQHFLQLSLQGFYLIHVPVALQVSNSCWTTCMCAPPCQKKSPGILFRTTDRELNKSFQQFRLIRDLASGIPSPQQKCTNRQPMLNIHALIFRHSFHRARHFQFLSNSVFALSKRKHFGQIYFFPVYFSLHMFIYSPPYSDHQITFLSTTDTGVLCPSYVANTMHPDSSSQCEVPAEQSTSFSVCVYTVMQQGEGRPLSATQAVSELLHLFPSIRCQTETSQECSRSKQITSSLRKGVLGQLS